MYVPCGTYSFAFPDAFTTIASNPFHSPTRLLSRPSHIFLSATRSPLVRLSPVRYICATRPQPQTNGTRNRASTDSHMSCTRRKGNARISFDETARPSQARPISTNVGASVAAVDSVRGPLHGTSLSSRYMRQTVQGRQQNICMHGSPHGGGEDVFLPMNSA